MDRKHLTTLEFPQILTRLAQHTSFSAGRELALALEPSPVFVEVEQRLQETREARYLLDTQGGLSLGGIHDIRLLVRGAARGAILQPPELLDIHSTLRVARRVRRVLGNLIDNALEAVQERETILKVKTREEVQVQVPVSVLLPWDS